MGDAFSVPFILSWLWSKSVAWLWNGVILFLLDFVINSFTRLSERQRTWWQIGLKTNAYRFTEVTIRVVCERAIVLWGSKLWNESWFCLKHDTSKLGFSSWLWWILRGLLANQNWEYFEWIIGNYWTGLSKISWFVSGEQINYLPKPKAEANNWSARHWQITIFCDNRVQYCFIIRSLSLFFNTISSESG